MNEYKEEYKLFKNRIEDDDLEKALGKLKRQYKDYVQSDKKEKEYISSLELSEK